MSIKAFQSLCPRVIFPVRVSLFPFMDDRKYSVKMQKQHVILLRVSAQHVGEGFVLIWQFF